MPARAWGFKSPLRHTRQYTASGVLRLGESKNGYECVIDRPQLVRREVPHSVAKPLSVDSSELFDEDARGVAGNGYLGSERGGSGAA